MSHSLPAQNLRKGYRLFEVRPRQLSTIKKEDILSDVLFFMAAELGIEPRQRDSETLVLPLHNSAKLRSLLQAGLIIPQISHLSRAFAKFLPLFCTKKDARGKPSDIFRFWRLFQALLVSLHHLLDHLAADGTGLLGGQVTVVTLLQVDAHLVGGLHLETVQALASLGNDVLLVQTVYTSLSRTAVLPPQIHLRLQTYCVLSNEKYNRQFVTKERVLGNVDAYTDNCLFFH